MHSRGTKINTTTILLPTYQSTIYSILMDFKCDICSRTITDSGRSFSRIDIPLQGLRAGEPANLCESCDKGWSMSWEVFQEREPKLARDFKADWAENPGDFTFTAIDWISMEHNHYSWRADYILDCDIEPWYWCDRGNDDQAESIMGRWVS